KRHLWVLLREPMDHRRIDGRYRVLAPTHAYLSHRRIVERRDILNALPQFVEHCDATLDERTAIRGRLDALPTPVKQAYTEGVLQVGNRFRNGRLRHVEGGCRLSHAARLNDGHQNVHVSQFEATADTVVPSFRCCHS